MSAAARFFDTSKKGSEASVRLEFRGSADVCRPLKYVRNAQQLRILPRPHHYLHAYGEPFPAVPGGNGDCGIVDDVEGASIFREGRHRGQLLSLQVHFNILANLWRRHNRRRYE